MLVTQTIAPTAQVSGSENQIVAQLGREARERLYPSLTNPNWLILRRRRQLFTDWLKRLPQTGLWVLDVGGRIQPYRSLLGQACERYVAVDIQMTPLVDVVGKAEELPLRDNQFDLVFCTQVLEYIAEPALAISEIRRVLKPGGWLLLSVPAIFPQDSDVEYWRFLPPAIRRLLSGFSTVDLAPEGNSIVGMLRTANVGLFMFAKPHLLKRLLQFTVIPLLNLLGAALGALISDKSNRFSANFSALAQK